MKKVSTKDIIILICGVIIIAGSIFGIYYLLNPKKTTVPASDQNQINTITGEIDQPTLTKIESLSDYGVPNMDNIGKSDLFK